MRKLPIVEVKNITKVFPGVRALDKVSLKLLPGEVHGLVGENGAGKSTLIKIISGVYQPSSGEIIINGEKQVIKDPSSALLLGIVPVHQELNLEQHLSVAENIYVGRQPKTKFGFVDYREMNRLAAEYLKELDVHIDPSIPLGMISIAERQMVYIARAISLEAKVLIFDEPTASLTEHETESLFQAIKKLKKKNISIIYISHRLEEVFHICDFLTIMRDGSVVAEKSISEITSDYIIRMMVGRDIKEMYQKERIAKGNPVLEVRNLNVKGILSNISFCIRSGEIVGIAGLVGAGRTELVRTIFGDLQKTSGEILIDGKVVNINSPSDAIKAGVGLVPEDRKEQGLVLGLPVFINICMAIISKITSLGIINRRTETEFANQYVNQLAIRTPSIYQQVQYLSGGNQQRVVIAKWLATNPKILLVDEPTRGIDVGAKAEIHALLNELVKKGVAILMISSELPEVLAMSDRILIMHQGQVKAELPGGRTTEEEVMRYATGHANA